MTGNDIRMRLVKNVGIRCVPSHLCQQIEVRYQTTSAALDGAIVFNLTRDENVPLHSPAPRDLDPVTALIFPKARLHDNVPKSTRPDQNIVVESAAFQQQLELAG